MCLYIYIFHCVNYALFFVVLADPIGEDVVGDGTESFVSALGRAWRR